MTDTDTTIDQALARQEERINRLSNAVGNLAEALFPVLNPERDGVAANKGVEGEFYPCKPGIFTASYDIDNANTAY